MKRWLLYLVAALSLVLCLLVVGIWFRTYFAKDLLVWGTPSPTVPSWEVKADRPGLVVFSLHYRASNLRSDRTLLPPWFDHNHEAHLLGFLRSDKTFVSIGGPFNHHFDEWHFRLWRWAVGTILVTVACWFALLWNLLLPGYRIRHRVCLKCGYDLRASKEQCPECGESIPAMTSGEGTP